MVTPSKYGPCLALPNFGILTGTLVLQHQVVVQAGKKIFIFIYLLTKVNIHCIHRYTCNTVNSIAMKELIDALSSHSLCVPVFAIVPQLM